jgi:hypothetical protein
VASTRDSHWNPGSVLRLLLQGSHVDQFFVAGGSALVLDTAAVDCNGEVLCRRFLERYPADLCEQVDAAWRQTDLVDGSRPTRFALSGVGRTSAVLSAVG